MTEPQPEETYREAYCRETDLLLGDTNISSAVSKPMFLARGADEIDAALARRYKTPIVFPATLPPEVLAQASASKLALKNINAHISTGRLLMAVTAGASSDEVQQYALYLLQEARAALNELASGSVVLTGAEPAVRDPEGDDTARATMVFNSDPVSQVDSFYGFVSPPGGMMGQTPRGFW